MAETAIKRTASAGARSIATILSARVHKPASYSVVWPSGHGEEVGVVFCTIPTLHRIVMKNGQGEAYDGVTAAKVREGDAKALVLDGLVHGPVSFVTEVGMPRGRLAIIADAAVDAAVLTDKLRILLHGLKFEI